MKKYSLGIVVALCLSAAPSLAAPPALLVDADPALAAPKLGRVTDGSVVRERAVQVRFRALEASVQALRTKAGGAPPLLALDLFPDRSFIAQLDRVTSELEGTISWIGHLEGIDDSRVVLVSGKGVLVGSVVEPAGTYRVRYAGGRVHVVEEIDPSALPDDGEPLTTPWVPRPAGDGEADAPAPSLFATKAAENGSTLDLMVVYTAAARTAAGGTTGMQNWIALGVTETNQSFANSNVIPRLRLVHTAEISYTESGSTATDLPRLRNPSDGYMDVAHTLRNTYDADMVQLIVNYAPDACGRAYLMPGANNRDFEKDAFGVVRRDCVSPTYSFGHELGHTMGCNHAPGDDNPVLQGAYSYSFGYRNPSQLFRTIMAYACTGATCPRVLQWSNPAVTYNGLVTGTSTQNNASSINNVRGIVANFRQAGSPYTYGSCAWSAGIKESNGTYYTCPNSKVMVGRQHSGDENGTTYYNCCNAYRSGVQAVPYSLVWSASIKESSGTPYTCPSGKVLVGRRHSGDENGYTIYQCAYLDFGGLTYFTDAATCSWSSGQKESSSNYTCAYDRVMAGRQHSGDENGTTWNYCCNLQ